MIFKKILLVDDEESVLNALKRELRKESYEIFTANNAVEATEILNEARGCFDVVISDNMMPEIKGTKLLADIKNKYPDIIRIMLTGQSSLDDAKVAVNQGDVYKFLTKPWDSFELKLIIRDALLYKDMWSKYADLKEKIRKQQEVFLTLEKTHPGITDVVKDESGNVLIDILDDDSSLDDYLKNYL